MKTISAVFVAVVIAESVASPWGWYEASEEVDEKPDFCKTYDCPRFSVLESGDDYELRQYETATWVSVDVEAGSDGWEDRSKMRSSFRKLFRYIRGDNDRQLKIPMTVPVAMMHDTVRGKISMSFMLPHDIANNAPTPTSPELRLYESPRAQIYVRSFGGFAYGFFNTANYFKSEAKKLEDSLTNARKRFSKKTFYTAGYDGPWTLWYRHNEVWFIKE